MSGEPAAVLDDLRERFGARLSTNVTVRSQHANTLMWTTTEPLHAVVLPETPEEVAAVARGCSAHGAPMISLGVGSSLEGQFNAPRGEICIDTSRVNPCLAVHEEDMVCAVQRP